MTALVSMEISASNAVVPLSSVTFSGTTIGRPSGMNLDFIPRDYLVFLHPVEPIADVGILTVAGLHTVRITDQRQQVSIAVIGKETFDVLFV